MRKQHPAYFRTAHTAVGDPTLTSRRTKWTQYCCSFKEHMKLQRKNDSGWKKTWSRGKGVNLVKKHCMNILNSLTIK